MGGKKKNKAPAFPNPLKSPRFAMLAGVSFFKLFVDVDDPIIRPIITVFLSLALIVLSAVQAVIYYRARFGTLQDARVYVTNSELYPDEFGIGALQKEQKFQVTYAKYDLARFYDQFRKFSITLTIGAFIYLYFDAPTPAIVLCVTQTQLLWQNPLFQVHVLAKNDRKLRRPWPAPALNVPFGKNGYFGQKLRELKAESEGIDLTKAKTGKNRRERRAKAKKN